MGVAGNLNDAGDITTPVYAYWPNMTEAILRDTNKDNS